MAKDTVVSFRLNEEQFKELNAVLEKDTPTGVNSENQQARKIVIDFLAGRLKYKNEKHRKQDMDQFPDLK